MHKIGITGQNGFLGRHLYNTLKLSSSEFHIVEFEKQFFNDPFQMDAFVRKCDTIVHFAGMNRADSPEEIYETNISLIYKLISSLERTESYTHIIFSSSTQEENDNLYGKSKRDGRLACQKWANGGKNRKFTGLIIPNVFGPFGAQFYNSVIATFCFQLTHNESPCIQVDGQLNLIYVGELVENMISIIRLGEDLGEHKVPATYNIKVSDTLLLLENYKATYFDTGIIPMLRNTFEINLFNTFRSFIDIKEFYPVKLKKNNDNRGIFVETLRLNIGGQVSFSTTVPGIVRGNHFHTRKIERFIVIKGEAVIRLRRIGSDEVIELSLSGDNPAYVDMPVWYTHHIENTGKSELLTIFWINEFFDEKNPDTYYENVVRKKL
jgi:UDP-2-acetamido-2,6-beta-L-arabino-hexul-4-ose reductase